jgi:serine/threonine-protein kinase RsbW
VTEHSAGAASVDVIDLAVPLRAEFSALLRTVTSTIGADLGLDLDEIDDLRLAVSEIFSVLLDLTQGDDDEAVAGARCRARLAVQPDAVTITLGRDVADDVPTLDDLAVTILSTVVDEFRVSPDGIVLVKRVAAPAASS